MTVLTHQPSGETLSSCPFCGGDAEIIHIDHGENAGGSCVCCTKCQASSNVEFQFKENFVSNWNRRATVASQIEQYKGENRICRICDGGPGNEGLCLCGQKAWEEPDTLRIALEETKARIQTWPIDDHATCMCGSPVETHSINSGHSPVTQSDYAILQIVEGIDAALKASK